MFDVLYYEDHTAFVAHDCNSRAIGTVEDVEVVEISSTRDYVIFEAIEPQCLPGKCRTVFSRLGCPQLLAAGSERKGFLKLAFG